MKFLRTLTTFSNFLRPTRLGRWEHRITEQHQEIKFILNNSDHCGDQICGDPVVVKNIIDARNDKNNKNDNDNKNKN